MAAGELREQHAKVAEATAEVIRLQGELTASGATLAEAEAELERRIRVGKRDRIDAQRTAVERARTTAEATAAALAEAEAQAGAVRAGLEQLAAGPDEDFALLDMDSPLCLIPVRLETRAGRTAGGAPEWRIRVYPDPQVDSHERALTEEEEELGRQYWEQDWRAASDTARARQAWAGLADRFGAERAAWIARQLEPLNSDRRPKSPVKEDEALEPAPEFPRTPDRRGASWTRAPHARTLPDRWLAIGYQAQARHVAAGRPIPDPLPAGPSPAATAAADAGPPVDPGMRWMVDFDAAEQVGMALRLALPHNAPARLDRLLVVGVKASLDPDDSAARLEELLEAQHHTSGLGLVPRGTPTNNTGAGRAGYTTADPGHEQSYRIERGDPLTRAGDGRDGSTLAAALGIDAGVFANVHGADGRDQDDARHMNTALWPVSWGYYLDQLAADGEQGTPSLPKDDLAAARRHFIEHVRARGPLPVLRIGEQPYGVMPVTALAHWRPRGEPGIDMGLLGLLSALRDRHWGPAVDAVPRVGASDPEADIVRVLGMQASSSRFAVRTATGMQVLELTGQFLGRSGLEGSFDELRERAEVAWVELGLPPGRRLARLLFRSRAIRLTRPLVQEGELSEQAPLNPNYIDALLKADLNALREQPVDLRGNALLYALLRHALLLEFVRAGLRARAEVETGQPEVLPEAEIVDVGGNGLTVTPWRVLEQPVVALTGNLPLAVWLATSAAAAVRTEYDEVRDALAALATRPTAALERVLRETCDLASHRLDAWLASFAGKHLAAMRAARPRGVQLGGYAWVDNLEPAPTRTEVDVPAGEEAPVYEAPDNAGYVHAPSLAHATSAAVLRSGHLSHASGAAGDALSIDLSSDRVRLALTLVDGVRQGQPLGALLGYRFERELHDRRLDRYIPAFRELAPLVAGKLSAADQPVTAIAANNVVDGLALLRRFMGAASPAIPWGTEELPALGSTDHAGVSGAFERLADAVDAIADLLLAESVHQAARGNHLRTGATLDALSRGEVPPPELEVVRTPRSGVGLTHRIAMLLPEPGATSDWPADERQVRATCEPRLNAWAADALGDPDRVRCEARYLDPATGQPLARGTETLRVSKLGLCPLDVVYAALPQDPGGRSELEGHLIQHAQGDARPAGVPAEVQVELLLGRDHGENWLEGELTLVELLELAASLRDLIGGARALAPGDLAMPGIESPQAGVDVDELRGRVDSAVADFREALDDLRAESPRRQRGALFRVAHFGVPGAVPLTPDARDTEGLAAQVESVAREADARQAALAAVEAAASELSGSPEDAVAHHLERATKVFGADFRVLPRFRAPLPEELAKALAEDLRPKEEPLAAVTWLQRAARVRPGADRLDRALAYAEALGRSPRDADRPLDLRVAQLPFEPGARWAALPLEDGARLPGGRVSLVLHTPAPVAASGQLAGLFVDGWVEVVPERREATGLSFHFNAPGARPPQAILLAVPPDPAHGWDLDTVEQTLLDTFELARLRGVDRTMLEGLGHLLPAIVVATNAEGDAVSTDLLETRE